VIVVCLEFLACVEDLGDSWIFEVVIEPTYNSVSRDLRQYFKVMNDWKSSKFFASFIFSSNISCKRFISNFKSH
jgi:hypothetical protein